MSIFRDEISVNDFKYAAFNDFEFAEAVTIRRMPITQGRATGNHVAGSITSITIDTAGSGYLDTPSYSVSGSGSSLVLDVVTVAAGVITGATIASSSGDWTADAVIQFSGGYEDTTLNAVVVREGVQKVNGRTNIFDGLRVSISKSDFADIDTGRDRIRLYKRLDDAAVSELRIVNIIAQNSAFWILNVK